jgi:CheY-like chemotaxis protein
MADQSPQIIVVDDEPDVIGYCQSYFGKRGFVVSTTPSGTAAVALVKRLRPDIMILDRSIPDMNGQEVLEAVRSFDTDIKIIILTGHSLSSDAERDAFYKLGISAYIEKPVVLPDLERLIHKILGDKFPGTPEPAQEARPRPPRPSPPQTKILHSVKNLLGNLRGQCEVYLLNKKDGIYKDRSDAELCRMAEAILKDTVATVDKTIKIMEKNK